MSLVTQRVTKDMDPLAAWLDAAGRRAMSVLVGGCWWS